MSKVSKDYRPFQEIFTKMFPDLKGGPTIKTITFIVTEDCNLNCSYCYQVDKHKDKKMSKETAMKAIDFLLSTSHLDGTNGIILEFIGGEPLLEIDLIDFIVDYFKCKAFELDHRFHQYYMLSLTTNGTLYDMPEVQKFMRKNTGRLSMAITIDGSKELHDACRKFPNGKGSYDIAESAFKKHAQTFKAFSTKLTLCPENIEYLFSAFKNMLNIGAKYVFSNCIFEAAWNIDHARIFYNQLISIADYLLVGNNSNECGISLFEESIGHPMAEDDNDNWCGGTGKMLAINTDGDILPCLRYASYSLKNRPPIIIGDVCNGMCHKSVQKEALDGLLQITRRSQSTDECFNCPIASGCAWCSAYNYQETGTPNKRVTYICIMHKARVLANYYYWNRLYKKQGGTEIFKLNIPEEWALEIITRQKLEKLKMLAD